MDNILNKIGDTVIFKTVPLWNLQTLTSYSNTITGLTATRTVSKFFRYSFDGVVFTDWKEDADVNLVSEISPQIVSNTQTLIIQVMFQRDGTDTAGEISIDGINLNGTYFTDYPDYTASNQTELGEFVYDDIDVFNLMVNLTEKMYGEGIVPVYLERQENHDDIYTDKDYIDFWSTMAKTFAVIFKYSIKFTVIYWRKELLSEFLKQRTFMFCDCSNILLLQHLAKNYYDEIRQRGTQEIFRPKGYEYPTGNRYKYQLFSGFLISKANPIWIDDIKYIEPDEVPFGWTFDVDGSIVAPDVNSYRVETCDNTSIGVIDENFDFSIIDTLPRINATTKALIQPTHFSNITKKINGEYLRLICYCANCDEFMFNYVNRKDRGWNIGNSSPMYTGLRNHRNTSILKGYENFSEEVWDLSYYPIIGSGIPIETNLIEWSDGNLLNYGSGNIPYA